MGIKYASPKKALSVQMSTPSRSRPAQSTKPDASPTPRGPHLEPLSLKLPPIRHILPDVFVEGPDDSGSMHAMSPVRTHSVVSSLFSTSPPPSSPSAYSSGASDYSKTTAPTTPVDDVFLAPLGSGFLSAANSFVSSLSHSSFHDDGGLDSTSYTDNDGLLGVQSSLAFSDLSSDVGSGDEFGIAGDVHEKSFDLGHTYTANATLLASSSMLSVSSATKGAYDFGVSPSLLVPTDSLQHAMKTPGGGPIMRAPPTTPVGVLYDLPNLSDPIPMAELDNLLNMFEGGSVAFPVDLVNATDTEGKELEGEVYNRMIDEAIGSLEAEYVDGIDAVIVNQEWLIVEGVSPGVLQA